MYIHVYISVWVQVALCQDEHVILFSTSFEAETPSLST